MNAVVDRRLQDAVALHQAGRLADAAKLYQRILTTDPKNADALNLLGVVRLTVGDAATAADLIGRAVALQDRVADFHVNLSQALRAQGRAKEAVASLRRAVKLSPTDGPAWMQLGFAERECGDLAAAVTAFRRAAQVAPKEVASFNNLATALIEQDQIDEARPVIERALALAPDNLIALANLGKSLILRGRVEDAIAPLRRAVAIAPDNVIALNNLGIALQDTGQATEALEVLQHALVLAPDDTTLHNSYGYALMKAGLYDAALVEFQRALAIKPDNKVAHKNRALVDRLYGRFDEAWDYYLKPPPIVFSLKERLARNPNFEILLRRHQGLGDELFFLRFLPELRRRGIARVLYEGSVKLASILRRIDGLDGVITTEEPLPTCDESLRISYLPLVLGQAGPPPPSLAVMPLADRLAEMYARLAALGPPPYIGVTWRAGTEGEGPLLFKLAPIADMGRALAGLPGTLVAVQRLPKDGEIDTLANAAGKPVHDLTALNEDLEGMLALMAVLDDYVTVSNTNVHLRALTGRVSRVLVPRPPDFRWMAEGAESPWFPGCRVYRQSVDRTWDGVLADLRRDLQQAFPSPV